MKILFIGNSHTFFNDMPHTVEELYRLHGLEKPFVVQLTHGGMTLDWHYAQPQVKFNIKYGDYDYIVLQDVAHPFIGRDRLLSDVEKMNELISKTNSKACLYMTWSEKINPQGQDTMCEAYEEAAGKYGYLLAPVGRVWQKAREAVTTAELYWQDGEHAGPHGSYMAACAIFCALTGRKTIETNLDDAFYSAYDKEAVKAIHECVAGTLG